MTCAGQQGARAPGEPPARGRTAAGLRRAARVGARGLGLAGVALAACSLGLLWHVFLDRSGLPDLGPFLRFELPVTGHVYDARGAVLATMARERRSMVSYGELPPILERALLAAEDKRFFSHPGVDFRVLPRVLVRDLRSDVRAGPPGRRFTFAQGGSTITQQLVRGWFLGELTSRERQPVPLSGSPGARLAALLLDVPAANRLVRKVEELRLALWLERELERRLGSKRLAKEAILARYASWVYLGRGGHGFAAASRHYLGRPLASLTEVDAPEAALLAGLVRSSIDGPDPRVLARALRRRNDVLALMVKNGWAPPSPLRALQARPIALAQPAGPPGEASGVVRLAIRELGRWGYGLDDLLDGRVQVRTTVDARIQALALRGLEQGLLAYRSRHPQGKDELQGAVVVLRNQDAAVLAEVGGRPLAGRPGRYTDYDRATDALRQPGSAMKPIVYLAALRAGFRLDTPVLDEPIALSTGRGRGWKRIRNHDGRYLGPLPLREALARSRNAATVWLAGQIGIRGVLETAAELGVETPLQPVLPTAIGASEVTLLELANAYRVMATGRKVRPHVLAEVRDRDGLVLREWRENVVPVDEAEWPLPLLQEALRGVVRLPDGTAHALDGGAFPVEVMGKTGTTNDFRDALFVGSTYGRAGLTVAVRVGFDDGRSLGRGETGARAALPVFRDVMGGLYAQGLAGPPPQFPPGVEGGIDAYLRAREAPPGPEQQPEEEPQGEVVAASPPTSAR